MIRVLVVDDSPTVRTLLVAILAEDAGIRVVGEARNGREAVEMAARLRPDLITMDVTMPLLDGLEATRQIMTHAPTPIVIVSSRADGEEMQLSLEALAAGALMVMPTPDNPRSPDFAERAHQLRAMVKAMSQVKVVRRWRARREQVPPPPPHPPRPTTSALGLVAIAASTGGPAALQRILSRLPRDFPVPIVVVQHIAAEFVGGLAQWLTASCGRPVTVARGGEPLRARSVYLAPDHHHLGVGRDRRTLLSDDAPIGGFRPSGTFLFDSAARAYGASVAAVILTGMGRDGVDGLRAVHAVGGLVLAQDEGTSVVYGMPGEAVAAQIVDAVLPLDEIADRLVAELASGGV